MIELAERYGTDTIRKAFDEIILRTKVAMQTSFKSCPENHEVSAEGFIDRPGTHFGEYDTSRAKTELGYKSNYNIDMIIKVVEHETRNVQRTSG